MVEPVKRRLPAAAVVRPVIVNVIRPLTRFRAERGVMVTIASGMPSPFSSIGSWATVAPGKATPLTLIVAGLICVTGAKFWAALLKTKIWSVAGVVALMLNGPKAAPTPIWVVIAFETGVARLANLPSTTKTEPAVVRDEVGGLLPGVARL